MLRSGRKHVVVSRKMIDDQAFTLIDRVVGAMAIKQLL